MITTILIVLIVWYCLYNVAKLNKIHDAIFESKLKNK